MHERDRFGQQGLKNMNCFVGVLMTKTTSLTAPKRHVRAMIDAGREAEIPEDAITITKRRKKLAADYDPEREYIPRKDRQEWQAIGLMGKLPLLKGQPTAPNWKKLYDLNDEVEMWLVRWYRWLAPVKERPHHPHHWIDHPRRSYRLGGLNDVWRHRGNTQETKRISKTPGQD